MTKQWKPVYLRLSGDRQKSLSFRRFAEKLLAQSKERNEELGNYPNPTYRYEDAKVKVFTQSLPGYDIIEIETPITGGKEEEGTARLYSGLFESRYNPAGVAWYLRYYPAEYEVYNVDEGVDRLSTAASIDGSDEALTTPMPPLRWMYNDYSQTPTEMPWFDDKFVIGPVAGRFSGKLRKLVQLQLGLNLYVGFGYAGSNCNGLRVEDLGNGRKQLWFYKIGGGVFMQSAGTYTEKEIAAKGGWGEDGVPPEILKNGWFTFQTEWETREIWDRQIWENADPTTRPPLGDVTFQLMDAASLENTIDGYAAQGDYGWSFNSDCSSAVFVGIGWNKDTYPYPNFQSQLFTISIYENYAEIEGAGRQLFVHNPNDQIKFPDAIGRLVSYSLWRNYSGFAATQPSSAYVAPQYAYYDLKDDLHVVNYEYAQGTVGPINGDYVYSQWSEAYQDCRQRTTYSATAFEFSACSYTEVGYGTDGAKHGFNTSIFQTNSYRSFDGWTGQWSALAENPDVYRESGWRYIGINTYSANAKLPFDHHALSIIEGTFNDYRNACVIVPSFDRCSLYHYMHDRRITSNAERRAPEYRLYEYGAPVWADRCFCISACGYSNCVDAGPADRYPQYDTTDYKYFVSSNNWPCNKTIDGDPICSCVYNNNTYCCWSPATVLNCPGDVNIATAPAAQNPYTEDVSTYSGAIMFPDGAMHVFSEDDILNKSRPFRTSDADFGYQDVVSAFDDFSGRWVYSQPEVWISGTITNSEYPTDMIKSWVGWVGDPGYDDE